MSQIAPQINYKPESQSANPKYRFLRVPLNNLTGSSFTLTATSSQVIEFKLPNAVYNLSQSFIQYEVAMASQGAGNYGWAYADTLDLATNAYFGTAGGLDLCNLNYVNRYVKIARKMKTRFSEMMANDTTSQLRPCLTTAPSNYYPVTGVSANIGTAGFVETQYLEPPSAAATAKSYYRQFPLKGIVDTIFALDKDLYIPTDMYVRFTAGTGNQIGFLSSDATAPPTGAGSVAGNITINSCYLWLAVEQNQLIVDSVMNKVLTSGLKLNIPYTTAFRNSSTGTVANVSIPLTSQYGKKLKRMLYTVWNGTESANTALDCSNYNGAKVVSYNSYIDNRQLQDLLVNTAVSATGAFGADDWRENQKYLKGSCILNKNVYYLNWFHCDQFYESNPLDTTPLEQNLDDGLDMSVPRTWQLQATTANSTLSHYNFATFVREVEISRNGVLYIQ